MPEQSSEQAGRFGRTAVFLDRDGVINAMVLHPEFGIVDSPANPDEMVVLPHSGEAIAQLNRAGLPVIVVSNQPGIAKGKFTPGLLAEMEKKMCDAIRLCDGRLDGIYYCLHHPEAALPEYRLRCECRKPGQALFQQAARDWQIDLSRSYTVGDGVPDILAGQSAGTRTLLVSSRKCYVFDSLNAQGASPDFIVNDLREAASVIISLESGDRSFSSRFAYRSEVVPTHR